MVATVATAAYLGLEARGVEVQCQVAAGVPAFNVVGLPDKAVRESAESRPGAGDQRTSRPLVTRAIVLAPAARHSLTMATASP